MLDITLIREKPDWIKEQITKLNDMPALERVDAILKLDEKRRQILTESETIQANRNKLNKAMGIIRGDKKSADEVKIARATGAVNAIKAGDFTQAEALMNGKADAGTAAGELTRRWMP